MPSNKRLEQTGFVTGVPKAAAQAKRYEHKKLVGK